MKKHPAFFCALICLLYVPCFSQNQTRITMIQGKVSVLKNGAADWVAARPNMPLAEGDQLYSREESFAEIVYANATIVRLDEQTKLTITLSSEKAAKAKSGTGDVWVNMRKLVSSGGRKFELSTPTATAAIRGTVFHTATHTDSSTDVSVYEGSVAVGPGTEIDKPKEAPGAEKAAPEEVPGPEEIPGPYEVSLDEWKTIVAGQLISVRKDGKFAQKKFNPAGAARTDEFVKKNIALDKEAGK
jgi:ferric-dicitrate binding protein FerR (iron transport regulator)